MLGQHPKAIEYHQQALDIAREIGDRRLEGNTLGNLGNGYRALGQFDKAIAHHQQALDIAREIGNWLGEGHQLANLGISFARLEDYPKAQECWQQALQIFEEIGAPEAEKVRNWLGMLADQAEKEKPAAKPAEKAPEAQEQGLSLEEWVRRSVRAARQHLPEAAQYFELASRLAVNSAAPEEVRKLAKVLRNILAGDSHPDLSALPAELADLVRRALEE